MARSLASPPLSPPAAAAGAWVALAATLLAIPVAPRVPVLRFHPVAAHGSAAATPWEDAGRVYDELDRRARGVAAAERARLARVILEEAARAELAPLLVLAVIQVESGYDTRAVSPAGAVGLMQLMPPTLREELALASMVATDPFEPAANVRAGVRYLGRLVATFPDLELALMAYNAGPGRIRRHLEAGGVPARFLGYPRDVLRAVERLRPASRASLTRAARGPHRALRAAHPARPAAPLASASPAPARGAPGPRALGAELLAALALGAAASAREALASVDSPRAVRAPAPVRVAPDRRACVWLDPALPMSRGRDRPRPVERALPS